MLMESFAKLDRKDKYIWDVSGRTTQRWTGLTAFTDVRTCKGHTKKLFTWLTDGGPFFSPGTLQTSPL
jgi:hypothetical protein